MLNLYRNVATLAFGFLLAATASAIPLSFAELFREDDGQVDGALSMKRVAPKQAIEQTIALLPASFRTLSSDWNDAKSTDADPDYYPLFANSLRSQEILGFWRRGNTLVAKTRGPADGYRAFRYWSIPNKFMFKVREMDGKQVLYYVKWNLTEKNSPNMLSRSVNIIDGKCTVSEMTRPYIAAGRG